MAAGPAMQYAFVLSVFLSLRLVSSHAAIWHPSMWGYNVTAQTYGYDNRPVVPLMHRSFEKWWFHGHLDHPPHSEDVFELPAGQPAAAQIACNKGATTFYASSEGGNTQESNNPNNVCPGHPSTRYHANNIEDTKGCGLAIAYKSDVSKVKPEDFTIFSVNHTCVWNRYTDFGVPEKMPPCPNDMCICAFFWIHAADSGSEQNYMNGFQCRVTHSTSNVGLAQPKVARRCGADPDNGRPNATPGNCTYGPKNPFYWFQDEQNNMFEGTYSPPFYNDLYNFKNGAQDDIFQGYYKSIPVPGPDQTALPVIASPGADSLAASPDASNTTPEASSASTASVQTPSPSATPSGSGNSQCPQATSTSAFSRRRAHAARGNGHSHGKSVF